MVLSSLSSQLMGILLLGSVTSRHRGLPGRMEAFSLLSATGPKSGTLNSRAYHAALPRSTEDRDERLDIRRPGAVVGHAGAQRQAHLPHPHRADPRLARAGHLRGHGFEELGIAPLSSAVHEADDREPRVVDHHPT